MKYLLLILIFFFQNTKVQAQLGFCQGSKGFPIFFEDFGSGTNDGPPLPQGYTNYVFQTGMPEDGFYNVAVLNNLSNAWHSTQDHTPDDVNGKALIINASFTPGEFYKRTVTGLCSNTSFEFSAWLMNIYNSSSRVCDNSGIPINVSFEIWDSTYTTLLKSGSTGNIPGTSNPIWVQYGLIFTTLPNQDSVILVMKNNGVGGCGNDLAIDDIMFRSCGDSSKISNAENKNSQVFCSKFLPENINLFVQSTGSNTYFYQWQESLDAENWTDIIGATQSTYMATITQTKYFRVKMAENISHLGNQYCHTISDVFEALVSIFPQSPISLGDKIICNNETIPALEVIVQGQTKVNWYSAASGGVLLQENSTTYVPTNAGIYYAEAYVDALNCNNTNRTPVKIEFYEAPIAFDAIKRFCEGQFADLDSNVNNVDYLWNTGETTKSIRVYESGIYTVTLTNADGCSAIKNIEVIENELPIISQVLINDRDVTIITSNQGDFEYALDGLMFQSSNVFTNVRGGARTAIVREKNGCGERNVSFDMYIFPKYFTPNNDGFNDVYKIEGTGLETKVNIAIFDRNGKLIVYLNDTNPSWDGTLHGKLLPASDYWFRAVFDSGRVQTGHFSLIR